MQHRFGVVQISEHIRILKYVEDVEGSRLLSRSADIKGKHMHLTFMLNIVGEKKTTFRSSSNPQNTNHMIVSALNLSGEL